MCSSSQPERDSWKGVGRGCKVGTFLSWDLPGPTRCQRQQRGQAFSGEGVRWPRAHPSRGQLARSPCCCTAPFSKWLRRHLTSGLQDVPQQHSWPPGDPGTQQGAAVGNEVQGHPQVIIPPEGQQSGHCWNAERRPGEFTDYSSVTSPCGKPKLPKILRVSW